MLVHVRRFVGLGLIVAALVSSTGEVRAGAIYGVTFFGNELIRIDTGTGAGTLVGTVDQDLAAYGLASRAGRLYAFDSNADVIRELDRKTGSVVDSIDIGVGDLLGEGDIAIRKDGIGFLSSALDPTTLNEVNALYRFDLETGTSTLVATAAIAFDGLAFGADGTLYGLGQLDGILYRIDTDTGAMTLIGDTGVVVGSPFGGITFGLDGLLYAALDDRLYSVNTTTGLATAIDSDPDNFIGFSSVSGLSSVVPEPSSLIMVGLGGVSCLAFVARSRRRSPV